MNDPAGMTSISRHRKVAASFRDAYLCEIFQLAVSLLQRVAMSVKNLLISDDAQVWLLFDFDENVLWHQINAHVRVVLWRKSNKHRDCD